MNTAVSMVHNISKLLENVSPIGVHSKLLYENIYQVRKKSLLNKCAITAFRVKTPICTHLQTRIQKQTFVYKTFSAPKLYDQTSLVKIISHRCL
jgi:hypothetical protein